MKSIPRPTHAILFFKPVCGCVAGICSVVPGWEKETARMVAEEIRSGLLPRTLNWEEYQSLPSPVLTGCEHGKVEAVLPLFELT